MNAMNCRSVELQEAKTEYYESTALEHSTFKMNPLQGYRTPTGMHELLSSGELRNCRSDPAAARLCCFDN